MALNDERPPPPISGSREGLVTMKIPMYSKREVSMEEDHVTALVEIRATASAAMRDGLDLVAVLDVSGSMDGPKLASMKNAIKFVIMKLTPLDRLSIVKFNGAAEVVSRLRSMTQAAQEELTGLVEGLVAGGATDINSGLVNGLEVLNSRVYTEFRTPNIFLMSDGKDEGETSVDATEVDPGHVVVYTFGFGAGTDHELLTQLAKNSTGGTYNSVPDGSNLSTSFAQLLGGLVTVVAQDVRLTLTPKKGPDLAEMTVAGDTDDDYTQVTDAASGRITVKFGHLFSGEVRTAQVDFKLKKRESEPRDFGATLALAEHSYGAQSRRQPPMFVRVQRRRNPSPPDGDGLEERTVEAEKLRRRHVTCIREASNLALAGDLESAREEMERGQADIGNIVLDDEDRTVNVLSSELVQLYDYMDPDSPDVYDEMGHPYALATIVSHSRQRVAGRGEEELVISLYITPRMVVYLEQAREFEEDPEVPVPSADDDVQQEMLINPLAAVSAPLAFYLDQGIDTMQAIRNILLANASQYTAALSDQLDFDYIIQGLQVMQNILADAI